MKRRSRAGSVKTRRRKSATPKRSNASNAARNRSASIGGNETVVARLTRERDEALLRETANSEILRRISSSPGDLELVFRTILEDATRICNANFGNLFRFDGEKFYPAAQFNTPAALLEAITRRGPFKPKPGISLDQVMRTKQVFHSADTANTNDKIGRLYRAIEDDIVDLDDQLKDRIETLKTQRDIIIATLERIVVQSRTTSAITPACLQSFSRLMNEKFETGDIQAKKAYLRSVIAQIEVADDKVRIIGEKASLAAVIAGNAAETPHVRGFVRKWRAIFIY